MKTCPVCQNDFKPSHSRGQIYCSYTCRGKDRRGPLAPHYKGGNINSDGYRRIMANGELVLEHRHIMSEYLGRPLERHEVVHHKDTNPLNNSIDNLKLCPSQREHRHIHTKPFRDDTHKECNICHLVKPRFEFWRSSRKGYDPNHPYCKSCIKSNYPSSWEYHKKRKSLDQLTSHNN